LMAQIIESEAHLELIESCFEQEYQYQLIDKVRTLFLGILIYTNKPDEQQRQDMLALLKEIKEQPEKLNNLSLALIYGDVILKLQPELNETNQNILTLPIVENLEDLNNTFKENYSTYTQRLEYSRFFLYFISIVLVFAVYLAFKRLQDMIKRLNIEIDL